MGQVFELLVLWFGDGGLSLDRRGLSGSPSYSQSRDSDPYQVMGQVFDWEVLVEGQVVLLVLPAVCRVFQVSLVCGVGVQVES